MTSKEIEKLLFERQDETYRLFQAKLIPNVPAERIIGVRTPLLRTLAKQLAKDPEIETFLQDLPHPYYDQNNLHGFIISECKDFKKSISYVDALLPYVNNWATCDLLSPKSFKKNKMALLPEIDRWLESGKTYTVRFGIEMLQSHFLDGDFHPEYLKKVARVKSEEYYINMMIAWFFATALTKQWDAAVLFIEKKVLSPWTHNKAIQKARESYRITEEQKTYLTQFKIPTSK